MLCLISLLRKHPENVFILFETSYHFRAFEEWIIALWMKSVLQSSKITRQQVLLCYNNTRAVHGQWSPALKAKTVSNSLFHCGGTLNLRRMIEDLGRFHLLCHSPWSFPGQTCGYFTSKFQTARVDKCSVSPAHSAHASKFIFAPLGESQCYYPSVLYFLLDLFMLTSCSNGIV